jgi:tRNA modification GTPase
VVTYFKAPASYTGEDVIEISAHGSPVVLNAIVRAAVDAGARLAEPGEFTLRAFLSGKIDLIQAEAVADLVDAVTPLQARAAFDQLEGTLTRAIGEIERELFDVIAKLEASLDFPDEGYHFVAPQDARESLTRIAARIDALLAQAARGRLIREGAQVAIVGAPNVGKSSLFNALLNANRAIVTAIPGTTRDLLTERADIGGLSLSLIDTAGVRETADVVEQEGVSRARDTIRVADLVLVVLDRSRQLTDEDRALLEATHSRSRVVVLNKSDLPAVSPRLKPGVTSEVEISAKTGAGLDQLIDAIAAALNAGPGVAEPLRDHAQITNTRHSVLLERARAAIDRAASALESQVPEEFPLLDLQDAAHALQETTGQRTSDDLLRHIFERFCIGK